MNLGEMTPVGGTWDPCGFSTPVAAPMTSASVVSPRLIRIAAALLLGPDGRTLLVRKRGTRAFMQPGGKIEAHEVPLHALARELEEELGLRIDSGAGVLSWPVFRARCQRAGLYRTSRALPADHRLLKSRRRRKSKR